jgi:hypothetical protein
VLNYYLSRSNIDKERFDITLSVTACIHQLNNARSPLKDVLKEAENIGAFYEVEVATDRVEKKFPHLTEDNAVCTIGREEKIELEVKARENRRNTQGSFRKLGRQMRGHVKQNSNKKSSLARVSVPDDGPEGLWQQIIGKDDLEDHLIKINVEQFSHAGATPFGYTDIGKYLGHTGDSKMDQDIYDGTLEHNALSDGAINAIVEQLRKHPAIDKILKPVVTPEDFKRAFKCVPEKTASSFSGRGVHHYKACAEGSDDCLEDIQLEVHASMIRFPLEAGFCPERWKQAVDVMLEKVPGISRSDKLRIIQLLEADLNQVLRIAFARNITCLAKDHEGIISEHQYGRAHKKCITPVLNKFLTIQILIQKKVEGIVFENDAKGCYDRIISGIALASLKMIGYSSNSVRMLGLLWAQLEHHIATGYGVSEKTYLSILEKFIYGIGQGGCASPILWALLNQLLLTALGEKFDCIRLIAVDGVEEHVRPGDAFVDDTTTGVTNDGTPMEPVDVEVIELTLSEEELIGKIQMIIQFFLDLLKVTGGDLAPEKCVWFLIRHRWENVKARLLAMKESHRGI